MRRCVDCSAPFEPARHYHRQCWSCWKAENQPAPSPIVRSVPILDAATIRSALALVHPDVHPPERQARALRVTQSLTVALARTRALERAA